MRYHDISVRKNPGSRIEFQYYEDNRKEIEGRSQFIGKDNRIFPGDYESVRHIAWEFDSFHEAKTHYQVNYGLVKEGQPTGYLWDKWIKGMMGGGLQSRPASLKGPDRGDGDFYTHKTPEEFIEAATHGYDTARQQMQKIALKISQAAAALARVQEIKFDVTGPEVDIDRLRRGEPECAYYMDLGEEQTISVNGKVIDLTVAVDASAYVSKNTLLQRGAVLLCLIDALENAGYNVSLSVYWLTHSRTPEAQSFSGIVHVKHAHQPIDVDVLTCALADGDVLRRLGFMLLEQNMHPGYQGGELDTDNYTWGGHGSGCTTELMRKALRGKAKYQDSSTRTGEVILYDNRNIELVRMPVVPYSDVAIAHANEWDEMIKKQAVTDGILGDVDKTTKQHAMWLIKNLKDFGVEAETKGAVA